MPRAFVSIVLGLVVSIMAQEKTRSVSSQLVGHPRIVVLPETEKGNSPAQVLETNELARQSASSLEDWLTGHTYDVIHPQGREQLESAIKLVGGIVGVQEDPAFQVALALGSDIHLTFAGKLETVAAGRRLQITLKAYETTTARLLGTVSTFTKPSVKSDDLMLADSSVREALAGLMGKVDEYWKQDHLRGVQYKVVLNFEEGLGDELRDDLTDALDSVLRDNFPDRREVASTARTADHLVWAPLAKFDGLTSVSKVFRRRLEKPEIRINEQMKNGKLIILSVKRR